LALLFRVLRARFQIQDFKFKKPECPPKLVDEARTVKQLIDEARTDKNLIDEY